MRGFPLAGKTNWNLRRLLALAALGGTIALVILQAGKLIRAEILMELQLDPTWRSSLAQLDLWVDDPDYDALPGLRTSFRFDAGHPSPARLQEILKLPRGRYRVRIRALRGGFEPETLESILQVTGDTQVLYNLPGS